MEGATEVKCSEFGDTIIAHMGIGDRHMNVLVLGGTGTVGSQVVRELLGRGVDVSVLTRDVKKPLAAGVKAGRGRSPRSVHDPLGVRGLWTPSFSSTP